MTKAILLSIHPKWAEKIYSGKKTIEWRKSFPKEFVSNETKVYLYETAPVCKVTGFFILDSVLFLTTASFEKGISQRDIDDGCVSIKDLINYKGDSRCIYGWRVRFHRRNNPQLKLSDFGLKRPPQSWCYTEVDV